MEITKDTIIGDVLDAYPDTAPLFLEIGMHCLGCPASRGESIADACAVHGTDADELVEKLNELGGKNGIGLLDIVENRLVGMKSRGVYETPGGTIIYKAHQLLEMITLDRDTSHYKKLVAEKYGELVYNGMWFSPLREALDAFVNKTQETVTGDVKLKLYKGNVMNAGVTSPYTLYDENVASFGDDGGAYNQADSAGFINLFGLSTKVKALLDKKREAND